MPKPKNHDTYARGAKSSDVTLCDQCGAYNHAGRWQWGTPPLADIHDGLCPACERVRDRYPAGTLRLPQSFLEQREELMGLLRNAEEAEKAEHPLARLMDIVPKKGGGLVVTTTGVHLARAIASKLERRFHKKANIRYPEENKLMFVDWES